MNDLQCNARSLVAAATTRNAPLAISAEPAPSTFSVSSSQYAPFSFTAAKPMRATLRLYAPDSKTFGSMWLDENGVFQFEGDASASAQVLFNEMKRLSGK